MVVSGCILAQQGCALARWQQLFYARRTRHMWGWTLGTKYSDTFRTVSRIYTDTCRHGLILCSSFALPHYVTLKEVKEVCQCPSQKLKGGCKVPALRSELHAESTRVIKYKPASDSRILTASAQLHSYTRSKRSTNTCGPGLHCAGMQVIVRTLPSTHVAVSSTQLVG